MYSFHFESRVYAVIIGHIQNFTDISDTVNYQQAKDYLLAKPEATLDHPFGPKPDVFKIHNKMFATLSSTDGNAYSNLKCDPEEALMLRDLFVEVKPGYHMNKKHWNTVHLDGNLPRGEIERMIDNSYKLVVNSLTRGTRQAIAIKYGPKAIYR